MRLTTNGHVCSFPPSAFGASSFHTHSLPLNLFPTHPSFKGTVYIDMTGGGPHSLHYAPIPADTLSLSFLACARLTRLTHCLANVSPGPYLRTATLHADLPKHSLRLFGRKVGAAAAVITIVLSPFTRLLRQCVRPRPRRACLIICLGVKNPCPASPSRRAGKEDGRRVTRTHERALLFIGPLGGPALQPNCS